VYHLMIDILILFLDILQTAHDPTKSSHLALATPHPAESG